MGAGLEAEAVFARGPSSGPLIPVNAPRPRLAMIGVRALYAAGQRDSFPVE
jgi:hypothetical protein